VVDDLNTYLALGIVSPLNDKVRQVRAEALQALGKSDDAVPQVKAANH
jgi:hypothetical protein